MDSQGIICGFAGYFLKRVLLDSIWADSYSIRIRPFRFEFDLYSHFMDSQQL